MFNAGSARSTNRTRYKRLQVLSIHDFLIREMRIDELRLTVTVVLYTSVGISIRRNILKCKLMLRYKFL